MAMNVRVYKYDHISFGELPPGGFIGGNAKCIEPGDVPISGGGSILYAGSETVSDDYTYPGIVLCESTPLLSGPPDYGIVGWNVRWQNTSNHTYNEGQFALWVVCLVGASATFENID